VDWGSLLSLEMVACPIPRRRLRAQLAKFDSRKGVQASVCLYGRSPRLVRRVRTRLTSLRQRRTPLCKTPTEEGAMATTLGTVTAITLSLLCVSVVYAAVLAYPLRSLCSLTP
jgi:hypothetical protein